MKKRFFKFLEIVRRTFSGFGLRKIGFIGWIYDYLFSHSKPEYFEIDGRKIYTDKLDILQLYRSKEYTYEDFINEVVRKEIKEGSVFLDLGAHVGFYTSMAAEAVGPNGKVFAFEPDPSNLEALKKTMAANGYKNVILEQKAVSDKVGTATFFLYGSTNNSMAPNLYDRKADTLTVETISMDEYFSHRPEKIDFIKMDIEGAEGLALRGMRHIFEKNKKLKMMTEFAPVAIKKLSNMEPIDFLKELLEIFDVFEINTEQKALIPIFEMVNGKRVLNMKKANELIEEYTPKTDGECFGTNFLCVKG